MSFLMMQKKIFFIFSQKKLLSILKVDTSFVQDIGSLVIGYMYTHILKYNNHWLYTFHYKSFGLKLVLGIRVIVQAVGSLAKYFTLI